MSRNWHQVTLWICVKNSWMFSRENNAFDNNPPPSSPLRMLYDPVQGNVFVLLLFEDTKKGNVVLSGSKMFYCV